MADLGSLWKVEFSVSMHDCEYACPIVEGSMMVWGKDIFTVLEKAREKIETFGYDVVVINGAHNIDRIKEEGDAIRKNESRELI